MVEKAKKKKHQTGKEVDGFGFEYFSSAKWVLLLSLDSDDRGRGRVDAKRKARNFGVAWLEWVDGWKGEGGVDEKEHGQYRDRMGISRAREQY